MSFVLEEHLERESVGVVVKERDGEGECGSVSEREGDCGSVRETCTERGRRCDGGRVR